MIDKDQLAAMARKVFQNTDEGAALFEYLVVKFYNKSTYSKGDAFDSVYKAGQRDVVLELIELLQRFPKTPEQQEAQTHVTT